MIVKTLDLFMAFLKVTNRELIQYIGNLNVMNVLSLFFYKITANFVSWEKEIVGSSIRVLCWCFRYREVIEHHCLNSADEFISILSLNYLYSAYLSCITNFI